MFDSICERNFRCQEKICEARQKLRNKLSGKCSIYMRNNLEATLVIGWNGMYISYTFTFQGKVISIAETFQQGALQQYELKTCQLSNQHKREDAYNKSRRLMIFFKCKPNIEDFIVAMFPHNSTKSIFKVMIQGFITLNHRRTNTFYNAT